MTYPRFVLLLVLALVVLLSFAGSTLEPVAASCTTDTECGCTLDCLESTL